MAEDGYAPGPIAWDARDEAIDWSPGGVFEDLMARATLEAPDVSRAIDQTRINATPTDPDDLDGTDDPDLIDGARELRAAVDAQAELRVTDEVGALNGIDPEISAGAQDIPAEDEEGGKDYVDERRTPPEREPPGRGGNTE